MGKHTWMAKHLRRRAGFLQLLLGEGIALLEVLLVSICLLLASHLLSLCARSASFQDSLTPTTPRKRQASLFDTAGVELLALTNVYIICNLTKFHNVFVRLCIQIPSRCLCPHYSRDSPRLMVAYTQATKRRSILTRRAAPLFFAA